ncbi:ImmA/IrrE family metallo-endopeptidase [Tessaracoccus palaemonis]|uniref:ImmA/IrrE family metallo-endopeptidase n=1 Tax=Tessaracoccus palaemonis TaxID=2829499 RepID=A0ABX8SJV5_9ACTN|nr:ImmA/IrrE family metallo-endopeptidase [Tessaracoccus palaemonis]QXT62717.1 ImmA/IrrE family metallo-endopeptidase [Tessaracoccus palaemonis]
MFDPWTALDHLGWSLRIAPTPRRGRCDWGRETITLDPGLTSAEQRAVLTHELVHAWRGPFQRRRLAREEAAVRATAAKLLVDVPRLADAAAWSRHPLVIADLLDVDAATVTTRAEQLDDDERAIIDARLADLYLP